MLVAAGAKRLDWAKCVQIDLTSSISTTLPFEALKQVGLFSATGKLHLD